MGAPVLAETLVALVTVFETKATGLKKECEAARRHAMVIREARKADIGGYKVQPHKRLLACMGPTGNDPAASF